MSSAQWFCPMNGPLTASPATLSKVDASSASAAPLALFWRWALHWLALLWISLNCIALHCIAEVHWCRAQCICSAAWRRGWGWKIGDIMSAGWCLYTSFMSQAEFLCSVQLGTPLSWYPYTCCRLLSWYPACSPVWQGIRHYTNPPRNLSKMQLEESKKFGHCQSWCRLNPNLLFRSAGANLYVNVSFHNLRVMCI